MELETLVFDIYRGTTHDGPGLRDTVFFKGCPLHCSWCHNPEGISPHQQVWWEDSRCIGCNTCTEGCTQKALHFGSNGLQIDKDKCKLCLLCTQRCPSKALRPIGQKYTVNTLLEELEKDTNYFSQFNGGVTASGGECTMQHQFVIELFQQLHQRGINTALDTCGQTSYEVLTELLPVSDYVLYDIKLIDCDLHKRFTGIGNQLILENLERMVSDIRAGRFNSRIWIRTPLVPGATATRENISAIAAFLQPYLGKEIERWEMCAFNNACTNKYKKLSIDWPYASLPLLSQDCAEDLRHIALAEGLSDELVILTGILL